MEHIERCGKKATHGAVVDGEVIAFLCKKHASNEGPYPYYREQFISRLKNERQLWDVQVKVESLHCETCKQRLSTDRHPGAQCPECRRAAIIAEATDRQTAVLNGALAKTVAVAVIQAIEEERRRSMATTTKKSDEETGGDIKREMQDGLWRAGTEALVDTARVTLVELLAAELPEGEREAATPLLANLGFQSTKSRSTSVLRGTRCIAGSRRARSRLTASVASGSSNSLRSMSGCAAAAPVTKTAGANMADELLPNRGRS